MKRVLITGSSGVIGSALCGKLAESGIEAVPFDIRQGLDIRDKGHLLAAMDGIDGVIHCAAVARVRDCEKNSGLCRETNVAGTKNIVECLNARANRPWLLFISSREVYGQAHEFPVTESTPCNPINEYARSKVEGERIVREYPNSGIIRLANVYGSVNDYDSRVIIAFTRAALSSKPLILNGAGNVLDFIHISDAVNGIYVYCRMKRTETIHLTSGTPVTLGELAEKIIHLVNSKSHIIMNPPNRNEVSRFCGNPRMARTILGWRTEVSLERGIKKLINEEQK